MILTVVTIVRNNPHVLETLGSLALRTTAGWNLLVIDGESTDGTSQAIASFLATSGIRHVHLRESDGGISDALNKGLRLADGDWVLFLNAGDALHPECDLSEILARLERSTADVLTGDAWMHGESRAWRMRGRWDLLDAPDNFWNPVCHQATFFRRSVHLPVPYDGRLRYTMDLDVLLRLRRLGARFESLDHLVCTYRLGGLTSSDRHYLRNHHEHDLVNRLNGRIPSFGLSTRLLVRNLATATMRRMIGPWLTSRIRRILGRP